MKLEDSPLAFLTVLFFSSATLCAEIPGIKVLVATPCDSASDYNGKMCLLGTYDTLAATHLPFERDSLIFALRIEYSGLLSGKHEITLQITSPSGKALFGENSIPRIPIELQRPPVNIGSMTENFVIPLRDIEFSERGRHAITVLIDGKPISTQSLRIAVEDKLPKPLE